MNQNTLRPGYEPIDGYVLRERLGAGGYGEVWKCGAPGGLQKAIKFIFGASNGTQASRELKSLHRVSKVYHPFLLSIERIETVNQQTLIITELAESSLEDRLQHYIAAGSTGIPRNELLQYFRDAADALDFLASEHSLQHLDVKPGNLLIVAKRIKVADFGLLKDLNDIQLSSVAGMTPAYSAPEVFDGRPAERSDQYSLAIAYVELLTGKLPFSGQTMAELAQQHLSSSPNLDALPPADREVVARALLKDPFDRFTTCRQFIDQLIKVKHSRLQYPVASCDTQVPKARTTNRLTAVTGATPPTYRKTHCKSDSDQGQINRCLFVGLGGAGCDGLARLKFRAGPMTTNPECELDARWLAIDTQGIPCESKQAAEDQPALHLEADEKVEMRLQSTDVYRNAPAGQFNALSRRWVYNIPRSKTTEGIRPLGLLAFIHGKAEIRRNLEAKLKPIIQSEDFHRARSVVYIMSSLHGGTGSGIVAEMGLLVREVIDSLAVGEFEGRSPQIHAVVTAGEVTHNGPARMAPAAAVATLSELSYHMSMHRSVPPLGSRSATGRYQRSRPFDTVSLLHGGPLGDANAYRQAIESMSSIVLTHACSAATDALSSLERAYESDHWLKTIRLSPMAIGEILPEEQFSLFAAAQALGGLHRSLNSAAEHLDDSKFAQLSSSLSLIFKTCESPQTVNDAIAAAWNARSSSDDAVRAAQLALDQENWTAGLTSLLVYQRLSWEQAAKIGRSAIATIRQLQLEDENYTKTQLSALLNCSPTDSPVSACIDYLKSFLHAAEARYADFEARGASFSDQLRAALKSVADAMPSELGRQLSAQISHSRSSRSLLSAVASAAMKSLNRQLPIDDQTGPIDVQAFAAEVRSIAAKLSISQDVKLIRNKSEAVALAECIVQAIQERAPKLSNTGGDISRLIVAPRQKLCELKRILPLASSGNDVLQHTTFVEASDTTEEPLVLCEGTNLAVPLLVQRQWRPSSNVFDLAEKLHTRVDVEWPAIHDLLEIPNQLPAIAQPALDAEADSECNPFKTPSVPANAPERDSPFSGMTGSPLVECEIAQNTQHI